MRCRPLALISCYVPSNLTVYLNLPSKKNPKSVGNGKHS